jgi:hypothetical protein
MWTRVDLYLPGGGRLQFEFPNANTQTVSTNYYNNSRLVVNATNDVVYGFVLKMPDGRQYVYEQFFDSGNKVFLTRSIDGQGFNTDFHYTEVDGHLRLTSLSGHDGLTLFSLEYTGFFYIRIWFTGSLTVLAARPS